MPVFDENSYLLFRKVSSIYVDKKIIYTLEVLSHKTYIFLWEKKNYTTKFLAQQQLSRFR